MKALKVKLKLILQTLICVIALSLFLGKFALINGKERIKIGCKSCTEQFVLGEIIALMIESHSDLKVTRRFNLEGTLVCFSALKTGDIDLYCEYTGTAILDILKDPIPNQGIYSYVSKIFAQKYNIVWLPRLGFSNYYGLVTLSERGDKSISDLAGHKNLTYAFDPEFISRLDLQILKNTYPHLSKQKSKQMDQVLLYFSLLKKGVDVISGSSTDGRLHDKRFTFLKDEEDCLPSYEVAPLVRQEILDKYPQIGPILSLLEGQFTEKEIRHMNYQVEFENRDPKELARTFLEKKELI